MRVAVRRVKTRRAEGGRSTERARNAAWRFRVLRRELSSRPRCRLRPAGGGGGRRASAYEGSVLHGSGWGRWQQNSETLCHRGLFRELATTCPHRESERVRSVWIECRIWLGWTELRYLDRN